MKLPVHMNVILLYNPGAPDAGPVSGDGPWQAVVPGTIGENRIEGRGNTPEAALGGAHAVATALLMRDVLGARRHYCPGIDLEVHFHIKKMKFPGRTGGEGPQQETDDE
jgi:hypothetical protein